MQKFNIYFITLISFFFISGERLSAQQFERQLNFCATASLWLPVLFENAGVDGADLCKVSGGTSCSFVSSLGEGICKASGICDFGGGSAIDIINAVVGMCGTRVLHYGYRGLK